MKEEIIKLLKKYLKGSQENYNKLAEILISRFVQKSFLMRLIQEGKKGWQALKLRNWREGFSSLSVFSIKGISALLLITGIMVFSLGAFFPEAAVIASVIMILIIYDKTIK